MFVYLYIFLFIFLVNIYKYCVLFFLNCLYSVYDIWSLVWLFKINYLKINIVFVLEEIEME